MRKPSDTMPIKDFILQKALSKDQETAKSRLLLLCYAYGYGVKETKGMVKELRRTGQIYCNRREEFLKVRT